MIDNLILGAILSLTVLLLFRIQRGATQSLPGSDEVLRVNDLITRLEGELRSAAEREIAPSFSVKTVDIEVNYTVKRVRTAGNKVGLELVALEASDQLGAETVHKLVLHLEALPGYAGTVRPDTIEPSWIHGESIE